MGHNYASEPALDVTNPYWISKGIYDVKNKYYKCGGGDFLKFIITLLQP